MLDEPLEEEEAEEYLLAGQYDKALAVLNRIIERDPNNANAFLTRGEAFLYMNRYEEALADYDHAVEIAPHDAEALAGRGEALYHLERFEEALRDLDRAAVLDPTDPGIFATRADVHCALEMYEEALEDYDRSIELEPEAGATDDQDTLDEECCGTVIDPMDSATLAGRAQVYRVLDRFPEALRDLNRVIEQDPDYAWAVAERAEVYRLMGQYGKALRDFNLALDLEPDEDWALSKRAEMHLRFRQFEQALADLNRAIEIDPDDWYFYLRALAWRMLEREEKAEADLRSAIERAAEKHEAAPQVARHTMNLATYNLVLGNRQEAERLYNEALTAGVSAGVLRETVGDLNDLLHLLPDLAQTRSVRDILLAYLEEAG